LLINLKIHSAYSKFFTEKSYTLEAYTASDVLFYLKALHPKFSKYMIQVHSGVSEEGISILDSKLNQISDDMLEVKKFKEGETIHLVPNISGGGGKRFRNALLFMALIVAAPYIMSYLGTLGAGGSAAAVSGTVAPVPMAAPIVQAGSTGLSVMKTIGLNMAMAGISALMTKSPAQRASKQTDSTTRDAGMFGGLTNSSTSGTPVALVYGMNRVGGQFLSGYISSISHGSSDTISVGAQFDGT
jgi:predicted phage tail protein